MERQIFSSTHFIPEGEVMAIVTVGIDLAKNVFAVHAVDEFGKPVLVRRDFSLAKLLKLIANHACLIDMAVVSDAQHWDRKFAHFGNTVRLMAPKFVAPYRMSGKRGRTMQRTPPPSAKLPADPTFALCRSSSSNTSHACLCTAPVKVM
jgi:transposase